MSGGTVRVDRGAWWGALRLAPGPRRRRAERRVARRGRVSPGVAVLASGAAGTGGAERAGPSALERARGASP